MMLRLQTAVIATALIVLSLSPARAADHKCAECGMTVMMDSKFASRISQGDKTLYFCDIGDLFAYIKRKGLNGVRAEVRDYAAGTWIDFRKAYYVLDAKKFKTPMGWGVAAFEDGAEASKSGSPMDFDAVSKALK